jgi:hypothetical protein
MERLNGKRTSLDFPSNLSSTSDEILLGDDRTGDPSFSPPMMILSSVCGVSGILLSTVKWNILSLQAYTEPTTHWFETYSLWTCKQAQRSCQKPYLPTATTQKKI